jgi:hypothetical protein
MTDMVLKGAASHLSVTEISESLGGQISPERVGLRLTEILNSMDWLTTAQKQKLNFHDMIKVKDMLMEKAQGFGEAAAAASGPLVRILKQIGDDLRQADTDLDERMLRVQRAHANVMVSAVELAFEKALFELHKRYPEIERGELQEILEVSLPAAVKSIEASVDE